MPLTNRNLAPGTVLAAHYKGVRYTCEVVASGDGVAYRVGDEEFESPSAAARWLTNASARNGWRFWSLAEELGEPRRRVARQPGEPAPTPEPRGRVFRQVRPARRQTREAEGLTLYFCAACLDGFYSATEPESCPQGHAARVEHTPPVEGEPVPA